MFNIVLQHLLKHLVILAHPDLCANEDLVNRHKSCFESKIDLTDQHLNCSSIPQVSMIMNKICELAETDWIAPTFGM